MFKKIALTVVAVTAVATLVGSVILAKKVAYATKVNKILTDFISALKFDALADESITSKISIDSKKRDYAEIDRAMKVKQFLNDIKMAVVFEKETANSMAATEKMIFDSIAVIHSAPDCQLIIEVKVGPGAHYFIEAVLYVVDPVLKTCTMKDSSVKFEV